MAGQHVCTAAASRGVPGPAAHLPDQVLPGNILVVTSTRTILSSEDLHTGILSLAG